MAIGIGTASPSEKLAVDGKVKAKEVIVETGWSDFVFEDSYDLPTLDEVKRHIDQNGRLPGIPSAQEVEQDGVKLGEMDVRLLQKIEELTLYAIEREEQVRAQQQQIEDQRRRIDRLEQLVRQLVADQ